MVRGYWSDRGGRPEWVEEAPDRCGCGGRWLPSWGSCGRCPTMGRRWVCSGCQRTEFDPEHECVTAGR